MVDNEKINFFREFFSFKTNKAEGVIGFHRALGIGSWDMFNGGTGGLIDYLSGKGGRWIRNYRAEGLPTAHSKVNKNYSMELKENAVQCYLTTDLTYEAVARKFEITNFTLLASWVNHFKIYGEVPISKKRGRRKKLESIASSMTQNPNDSQRIKELEQELRYAQIEVAYLKGLRRLEKNALMNKNQDSSTVSVKPSNSKKS